MIDKSFSFFTTENMQCGSKEGGDVKNTLLEAMSLLNEIVNSIAHHRNWWCDKLVKKQRAAVEAELKMWMTFNLALSIKFANIP